jgi:hypothetical protein
VYYYNHNLKIKVQSTVPEPRLHHETAVLQMPGQENPGLKEKRIATRREKTRNHYSLCRFRHPQRRSTARWEGLEGEASLKLCPANPPSYSGSPPSREVKPPTVYLLKPKPTIFSPPDLSSMSTHLSHVALSSRLCHLFLCQAYLHRCCSISLR